MTRSQDREDFFLARQAIPRATRSLELADLAHTGQGPLGRRRTLAVAAAQQAGNPPGETLLAAPGRGIALGTLPPRQAEGLEIRVAGRYLPRHAAGETRSVADGILLVARTAAAGRRCLAATGAMREPTGSGVRLETREMAILPQIFQDGRPSAGIA